MNPINFLTEILGDAESWEITDLIIAISVVLAGAIAIFRLDQDDTLDDEDLWAEVSDDEINQDDEAFDADESDGDIDITDEAATALEDDGARFSPKDE
ncbi:MAG: hypothetical protein AAF215_01680 [Cyanobacteria bacterium P01_A01_bin.123]